MQNLLLRLNQTAKHLKVLHKTFSKESNFNSIDKNDFIIYKENLEKLKKVFSDLKLYDELYGERSRQMILADLYEYILLGRGIYVMKTKEDKEKFVMSILHFVNLLMCYESITVSTKLRRKVLIGLKKEIPEIANEKLFLKLLRFKGNIGLPQTQRKALIKLNNYFDKILPKTAGGLWHELLVYVFLLRSNKGYILPLLLSQRLFAKDDNLVPPDFLLITKDKRIYGVEVGTKKEIQSGSFSLKTAIPTATIDTTNSRNSDRCPLCKKWIQFCPYVINIYSDFDAQIKNIKVRCLVQCNIYKKKDILNGKCKYTKYSRKKAQTLQHTQHNFADGLHYHYHCVLKNVSSTMKKSIIAAKDTVGIKTHFPNYSGIEELNK